MKTSPMESAVLKYVRELSPDARARVLAVFSKEVDEFAHLVYRIIETLQRYHEFHKKHDENNPKEIAFSLMTKGANTLMAGFELVVGGYMWEPPILFRSALEGFAVAWDIAHNPKRFDMWKKGKTFHSTDSISNVKREVESVGKMYGFLSNVYVHTGSMNSSPPMTSAEKFQFFGLLPAGKENIRKGEVYFALVAAHVCLQLTELVFHAYAAELETIQKISGTDKVRNVVHERHRPFVEAAMNHFTAMAEGKAP